MSQVARAMAAIRFGILRKMELTATVDLSLFFFFYRLCLLIDFRFFHKACRILQVKREIFCSEKPNKRTKSLSSLSV